MLISKEELENLERYEASQARRSERSIQEVLEATFEENAARSNPYDRELPFKKLSRKEARTLVLDQLRRFFRWDGKSESEADEVFERAEEKLQDSGSPDFDLGKVIQDMTDVASSKPNFVTIYNALLLRKNYDSKSDTYLPEAVVSQFAEAVYLSILGNEVAHFADTLLLAEEGFSGGFSERRESYGSFIGKSRTSSRLESELRQRRRTFAIELFASIEFDQYEWFDDTLRKGLLYLCCRLLTLHTFSPNYKFLQVVPENGRFLEAALPSLLQVTADYWSNFESFEDIIAFATDPAQEPQRVVVDKTLTLIAARFIGKGTPDFEKWFVAVGFSGFKRLLSLVEDVLFDPKANNDDALEMQETFSHAAAGILLTIFALIKMPANQLKGYSKKLKARAWDEEQNNFWDEEQDNFWDEEQDNFSEADSGDIKRFFRNAFAPTWAQIDSQESFFFFEGELKKLVNSVSASAGLFLSFAKELHQKAGGSLTFDEDLLTALVFDKQGVEGYFEREVALCAAILSVLPEKQYDEITNLKSRNFDYLQGKILNFLKTRPSLTGESLIQFYLNPQKEIFEKSYLDWCRVLFDVFKAAEGASDWKPIHLEGYDADLLSKFDDDAGDFLKVYLESDDPTLNFRDFEIKATVCFRGGSSTSFRASGPLAEAIQLADAYRRLHLGVGGNVDKTLHPKWHEVLPAEGLYFVELPRFHPIWWIIGSVSIANCCMTPDGVGRTASRSGFWGNRDRSFLVVHKPSATIIGSLQAVGMRLGTKGPWGLAFDGFERRNPQKSDSAVQKQALEKYLTTEPFYSEPQVLAWMREHIPYLPKKDSDRAYSGYIDYFDPAEDSTLRDLDRLVTISDATAAYRDYALSGVDVRYVGANPPTPAQIWAYEPDLQVVDLESLTLDGHRFAPSAKLIGTTFENCSLVGVSFEGCDLDQANFLECNLTRANFTGATLTGVAFDDCTLGNAIFDQADLTEVTFANDSFSRGVGLRGASFKDTSFNDVNFETAKFVEEALYLDNLPPNALVRF